MNTFQAWVVRLIRLDTDQYIRSLVEPLRTRVAALEYELQRRQGFTTVMIDPTMRTAYPQQEPHTDPTQSARARAATHQLYPHRGDMGKHALEMEHRKKQQPGPQTHMLPTF